MPKACAILAIVRPARNRRRPLQAGRLPCKNLAMPRKKQEDREVIDQLAISAGKRLRWARESTGLNRSKFARAIDIHPSEWSRWENAKRNPPAPHRMLVVCLKLRISMDYIYRGLLIGVHPELAQRLLKEHPGELKLPPTYTGWDTDTDPSQ